MKFVGPFEDSASQFQLILNVSVSRPGSSGNYTISGKIKAKDGDYSVSGTVYANSRKVKANVRRAGGTKPFEQPLDGFLSSDKLSLNVSCLLLSPVTKVAFKASFKALRMDNPDESEMVGVFVRQPLKLWSDSGDLAVDLDQGTAQVRHFVSSTEKGVTTLRFSPLPAYFMAGGRFEFWGDASALPNNMSSLFKISCNYIDVSGSSPFKTLDLTKQRKASLNIVWNMLETTEYSAFSFEWGSSNMAFVAYKRVTMSRAEFNRLGAAGNAIPLSRSTLPGSSGGSAVGGGNVGSPSTGNTGKPDSSGKPAETTTKNPNSGGSGRKPPAVGSLLTTAIQGEVDVRLPGKTDYQPLTAGMVLAPNTLISTGPEDSATFQLPNGATLTLTPGTTIRVEELTGSGGYAACIIRIRVGEIKFQNESKHDSVVRSDFVIRMNECVSSTRGTAFSMRCDEKTGQIFIQLTEGKLEFKPNKEASPILLEAPTTFTFSVTPPSRKVLNRQFNVQ